MQRPKTLLLLLLARWRKVLTQILETKLGSFLLSELIHLATRLGEHIMGDGAIVLQIHLVEHTKQSLIGSCPHALGAGNVHHASLSKKNIGY